MGRRFFVMLTILAVGLSFTACPVDLPQSREWTQVDLERSPDEKKMLADKEKRARYYESQALLKRRQIAFIQPEERHCTSDDECRLVATHCCSCERGGAMTAMRTELFKDMVKRRVYGCEGHTCTQAISRDPSCQAKKALCVNNQCVAEPILEDAGGVKGIGVEPIDAPQKKSPE